jgi:hypothetical protein
MAHSTPSRSDRSDPVSARRPKRTGDSHVPRRTRAAQSRLALWLALAVGAVTFAVYAGAFDHSFVDWDDQSYVTENALVLARDFGGQLRAVVSNHWHPLTMLSLAANVSTPLAATPFVVTNVVLHGLNTALVFWLVSLLVGPGRPRVAALTALVFGIHPMHVESVAWIAERKDVLFAFFFLGAAIAYLHFLDRRRPAFLALTFALFLASCLSKEMAVAFPGVMVLLEWWRGRKLLESRALLEKLPFVLVSILFGVIVLDLQRGGDFHGLLRIAGEREVSYGDPGLSPLARIGAPTYGAMMYVWRFFVPLDLCAFYPFPGPAEARTWPYLVAPLFFLATVALALWSVRRARVVAFALGWFLVTVALVLRWIPSGLVIMGDRYTYLPYIGLGLLVATGIETAGERRPAWRPVAWGAAAIFAAWLAVLCRAQIGTWRNSETLWTRVIEVQPRVAWAHLYRGKYFANTGRFANAGRDFQSAHDLGLRNGEVLGGLGIAHGAQGRLDSSLVMLDRAIALEPRRAALYFNRAVTRLGLGRPRGALADLDRERALARVLSPGHDVVRRRAEADTAALRPSRGLDERGRNRP